MLDKVKTFLKGFRTALYGTLISALGFLETFNYIDIVPDGYENLTVGLIGLSILGLRYITNSPMFKAK